MEFLEVPLIDDDILKLLVRFGIDLLFLSLIVVFGIYPNQRSRDFAFTAVMLNVIVFFICFTMKKLELDLGLALGLFAVFGVLRYRTDSIRPKEMTYLFIVIGVGVINALANRKTSYAEVALVNGLIFGATMLKEWIVVRVATRSDEKKPPKRKSGNDGKPRYAVTYDHPEWLGPEFRETLLTDLQSRTGLKINDIEIKTIDLSQNTVTLSIRTAE